MNDVMWWMVAAIVGELVLLLLVFLGISWFRNRAARKRDLKAMAILATRIRKSKSARAATLKGFVTEKLDLAEDRQRSLVAALSRAELVLLQEFLATYRDRDATSAAKFDHAVYAALANYQQLSARVETTKDGSVSSTEVAGVDTAELAALRKENQRLADELTITMETMSRMLNEYSTMFSGGQPVAVPPIAATPSATSARADKVVQEQPPAVAEDAEAVEVVVVTDDEEGLPEVVTGQQDVEVHQLPPEDKPALVAKDADHGRATHDDLRVVDKVLGEAGAEAASKILESEQPAPKTPVPTDMVDDSDDSFAQTVKGALDDPNHQVSAIAEGVASVDADAIPKKNEATPGKTAYDAAARSDDSMLSDSDLRDDVDSSCDGVEINKGGDIDAVSALLVVGEPALVTPEGAEVSGADNKHEGLFGTTEESLFDVEDTAQGSALSDQDRPAEVAAELDDLHDPDGLFPDEFSEGPTKDKQQA